MAIESASSAETKDWLVRDLELAGQAAQLSIDCQLDYLIGPLDRLFPDAHTTTEALISLAVVYDHDVAEVASVLTEVLIESQNLPLTIDRFIPFTETDTILPAPGSTRFRIGRTEREVVQITLPDQWDAAQATAADLQRRADLAGDIALYFSEGIKRQLDERSPAFIVEATKAIEPFIIYAEELDKQAEAVRLFEQQNEEAITLASAASPTDQEIIESHLQVDFYQAVHRLTRAVLVLAA